MSKRVVTLAGIEAASPKENLYERSNYLMTYGIRNPWTAWILRQDSRLLEKPSGVICGWSDDWSEALESSYADEYWEKQ